MKALIYTVELILGTQIKANWLYQHIGLSNEPRNKQKWPFGEILVAKMAKNCPKLRSVKKLAL